MTIYTYENLYRAYLDCRKNKRKTINQLRFEIDLENNLKKLLDELNNGSYALLPSICFVATDPCPREIFASDFRDRIVHHLFVREICEARDLKSGEIYDLSDRLFIFDSYACRKNKGNHKAAARLAEFIRRKENRDAYCLKIDIQSFFISIDMEILYNIAKGLIERREDRGADWKSEMRYLALLIIFARPAESCRFKGDRKLFDLIPAHKSLLNRSGDKGMPIGNHTSQFFANLYLSDLDHYIKRRLRCRFYVRYADDMVIIDKDKIKLENCQARISEFAEDKLKLKINRNKTILRLASKGVDFLGYFIKPTHTLVRRKVVGRFKGKLYDLARKSENRPAGLKDFKEERNFHIDFIRQAKKIANSYQGHFQTADAAGLIKKTGSAAYAMRYIAGIPKRKRSGSEAKSKNQDSVLAGSGGPADNKQAVPYRIVGEKKNNGIFSGNYWSATENSDTNARNINFSTGGSNNNNKTNSNSVRCVRGWLMLFSESFKAKKQASFRRLVFLEKSLLC